MDAAIALAGLGGVARATRLLGIASRHSVASALAAGTIRRPFRGVYALPDAPKEVVAAVHFQGFVSHESAAALWGLAVLGEPKRHHITVPHNRQRRGTPGVRLHYARLKPGDLVEDRWPLTSLARTIIDCCRTLPLREAVVIGDSAVRQVFFNPYGTPQWVTLEELRERVRELTGPGSHAARRAIGLLDPGSESVAESVFRALIHLAGFPPPISQFARLDGRIRIDFCWPEARIAVEIEGYEFHSSRSAWRRDCRRNNELVRLGIRLYRFTWNDVVHDPAYVVRTLRRALAVAGVHVGGQA